MTIPERVRYQTRLDGLFKSVGALGANPEMQSHFAKYLCVLVSGYLEVAIKEMYTEFAKQRADKRVVHFVGQQLGYFQNLNVEKIRQLAGGFDKDWGSDIENFVSQELKSAVDSIVANRNQISHGVDVGLTFTMIRDYYERSQKLLEFIENQCRL